MALTFPDAMAVGPLGTRFPPVAVRCDVCDRDVMTWRCYRCGGTYCGYCIFRHGPLAGAVTLAEVEDGRVDPDELAEGMHALWWRLYQRLASEMASYPAFCAMHALRLGLNAPCR